MIVCVFESRQSGFKTTMIHSLEWYWKHKEIFESLKLLSHHCIKCNPCANQCDMETFENLFKEYL